MNYFQDEINDFIELLEKKKPNLLLIGVMTLSYPGAIALAKCAKAILKNDVFIVLGGKHCIETFSYQNNAFYHHKGSPLKNMIDSNENYFDLVLSGDGEEVIVQIGEMLGDILESKKEQKTFFTQINKLQKAKGKWFAGWIDKSKKSIEHIKSNELLLNYDSMPTPAEVFGITAMFPIFESDITGHAYSYMSKGCVYNCYFCSEKSSINGKMSQKNTAPERLYKQFEKIREIGIKENKAKTISAFVEDSIILSGNINLLKKFNELLKSKPLSIKWGCQLTIDLFLRKDFLEIISELKEQGLMYILFGMETINENIASKMSKNSQKKKNWTDRNEEVLHQASRLGLKIGFTILWGLGEHSSDREKHLKSLKYWKSEYGLPNVISLNWAVQHPLINDGVDYDFLEWGTPINSKYLEIFIELFGEASEKYCLENIELPHMSEMEKIKSEYLELICNTPKCIKSKY